MTTKWNMAGMGLHFDFRKKTALKSKKIVKSDIATLQYKEIVE
jgi:hypothetical protein